MSTITFRKSFFFRLIAITVLAAFALLLPVQPSFAQVAIVMPPAGQMIHITNHFEPPQMLGIKVDLKDPFSFDFIMDRGQIPMPEDVQKEEFNKIIKYFLVSLTMPNSDMWVNLSPYESKRLIPEVFAQTEMGRDLLAQDYILKQFTASLMYPEGGLGRKFWDAVYAQARKRFGTTEININTFNKVWIVADHADVYQKDDTAFLIGSHLKVMLEQDYKAIEKNKAMFGSPKTIDRDEAKDAKTRMASQLVREIIVPAIEKEVNEGRSFAAVRQVYNAEILATWYKKTLRQSLLGQVFANKSKIAGQRISNPQAVMEKIYTEYLRAYKKGVFNYVREDAAPDGQTIPRKYFSGGLVDVAMSTVLTFDDEMIKSSPKAMGELSYFGRRVRGLAKYSRILVVSSAIYIATLASAVAQEGAGAAAYLLTHPEMMHRKPVLAASQSARSITSRVPLHHAKEGRGAYDLSHPKKGPPEALTAAQINEKAAEKAAAKAKEAAAKKLAKLKRDALKTVAAAEKAAAKKPAKSAKPAVTFPEIHEPPLTNAAPAAVNSPQPTSREAPLAAPTPPIFKPKAPPDSKPQTVPNESPVSPTAKPAGPTPLRMNAQPGTSNVSTSVLTPALTQSAFPKEAASSLTNGIPVKTNMASANTNGLSGKTNGVSGATNGSSALLKGRTIGGIAAVVALVALLLARQYSKNRKVSAPNISSRAQMVEEIVSELAKPNPLIPERTGEVWNLLPKWLFNGRYSDELKTLLFNSSLRRGIGMNRTWRNTYREAFEGLSKTPGPAISRSEFAGIIRSKLPKLDQNALKLLLEWENRNDPDRDKDKKLSDAIFEQDWPSGRGIRNTYTRVFWIFCHPLVSSVRSPDISVPSSVLKESDPRRVFVEQIKPYLDSSSGSIPLYSLNISIHTLLQKWVRHDISPNEEVELRYNLKQWGLHSGIRNLRILLHMKRFDELCKQRASAAPAAAEKPAAAKPVSKGKGGRVISMFFAGMLGAIALKAAPVLPAKNANPVPAGQSDSQTQSSFTEINEKDSVRTNYTRLMELKKKIKQNSQDFKMVQERADLEEEIIKAYYPQFEIYRENFNRAKKEVDDLKNAGKDTAAAQEKLERCGRALREHNALAPAVARLRKAHPEILVVKPKKDKAQVGGISLSDENLTIDIKVDGVGMPLPASYQDRAMRDFKGLTSIIRRIMPPTPENVPVLYQILK